MQLKNRPWLSLYRNVPATIEPACDTALAMFRATVQRKPDAPLVHYFDTALTAGDCDALSDALAVALQERGIEAGDRVAIYLQNVPQVVLAVLAAWKCGAVIVPCNPMLRERELAKILRASGCRILICHEDLYGEVAKGALPSTAVEHAITTSPLDFLPTDQPAPAMIAGIARVRHPGTTDLLDLITWHGGKPRAQSSSPATTSHSWCTRRARPASRKAR